MEEHKTLSARIPRELAAKAKKIAKQKDRTMSWVIKQALLAFLGKESK
tara:strand:- start:1834 stop:1977 length:144 start_codon:yes stop_codon:yes gene_type:complete